MSVFKNLFKSILGKDNKEVKNISTPVKRESSAGIKINEAGTYTRKNQPVKQAQKKPAVQSASRQPVPQKRKTADQLPEKIRIPYNEAKKYASEKNTDEAIKSFKIAFELIIERICERYNQPTKDKSLNQMIASLEGHVTDKQLKGMRIVKNALARKGNYAKCPDDELLNLISSHLGTAATIAKNKTKNHKKKKSGGASQPASATAKGKSKAVDLSFKKRETVENAEKFDAKKEFPDLAEYCLNAEKRLAENNYKASLYEIRMALELIVKELCKKYHIPCDETQNLKDEINELKTAAQLSDSQTSVMHSVRKLGNLGTHHGSREPGANDADRAIREIKKVIEIFELNMSEGDAKKNTPLLDPIEYYDVTRKYHGRWADCYTYQAVSMRPGFIELKRRADDGDIEAMLDIASGFLPANIYWTKVGIIGTKAYSNQLESYDARYYYWILKACNTAYNNWKTGKYIPLKYIATALLEGIKFIVYHEINYWNIKDSREICMRYNDQYVYVEKQMFGKLEGGAHSFADMLIYMMDEYNTDRLVSPVHRENQVKYVKFLIYLLDCRGKTYTSDIGSHLKVDSKYAIEKEDAGKPLKDVLPKYSDFVYNMHRDYCRAIIEARAVKRRY